MNDIQLSLAENLAVKIQIIGNLIIQKFHIQRFFSGDRFNRAYFTTQAQSCHHF